MVYCVEARLAFSTSARRDTILADIQSRISGKQRWSVDVLVAADLSPRVGQFGIIVELRFISKADADDLKNRIEAFATGQRLPVAGSWITIHDCSHDEGTNSCTAVVRRDW